MQSASTIQRTSQRRTPNASDDLKNYQHSAPPTPTQPSYNGSQSAASGRSSSGSGGTSARSGSGRRRDPSQQLSQIEKSVTHLLIATKQLLETLTQWSRHQATEGEVSDVYVRLGYEFNIACRAFTSIGVDVSDLGNVPDLLRTILEDTLSQDPSPASLDRYLPRIRDIIINLLHGLKRKQQKLRTRPGSNGQANAPRQGSMMSSVSGMSDLDSSAIISGDVQSRFSDVSAYTDRPNTYSSTQSFDEQSINSRMSSFENGNGILPQQDQIDVAPQMDGTARISRRMAVSNAQSLNDSSGFPSQRNGTNGTSMENPGPPPQPPSDIIPKDFPAPPPVPPAQPRAQDALAALQRGGELERRASRRYSAYQIQKHLGQSPGSVPMIPPTQHGPIPNRGKEQRDSLNAVRSRSSLIRQRSSRFVDSSPSRAGQETKASLNDQSSTLLPPGQTQQQQDKEKKREGSPLSRQTTAQQSGASGHQSPAKPDMRATLTGPLDLSAADYEVDPSEQTPTELPGSEGHELDVKAAKEQDVEDAEEPFVPADSPEPGKPLTVFLQYKTKIKKYVLQDGAVDLTMGRLQLAFIEKFAWHTYNNGVDLPEIYIQDPVSGVRHELEDLSDIKDRTVLVLNVEAVDEVKRHFDGALGGIQSAIDSMRGVVEKQQVSLIQVSKRQEESSREIAKLAAAPPPVAPVAASVRTPAGGKFLPNGKRSISGEHMAEVQTLRRDLAVMRQTLTTFTSGINTSMDAIRKKAVAVQAKAADAAPPPSEGEEGRAYVNAGKKSVGDDSENLVNKVDDLQDVVEELRKDVTRGVRPLPDQLKSVTQDINKAGELLKKMKATVKKEKPIWTKIWEKELELVCTDREFLTLQEELIADLEDDLEKTNQTFALVQEASKQQTQNSSSSGGGGSGVGGVVLRNTSRGFGAGAGEFVDAETARAGLLGEVRALQPNHESRIEAIERAEKARKKELEIRKDGPFMKELSSFVEDGRLRKTGGVDEIERVRLIRDDANLKVTWDVEQEEKARRKKERAEKKKREAAERAAQAEREAQEAAEGGGESMPVDDIDLLGEGGSQEQEQEPAAAQHEEHEEHEEHSEIDTPRSNSNSGPTFDDFAQNGFHDSHEQASSSSSGMGNEGGGGEPQRKSWLPSIFSG